MERPSLSKCLQGVLLLFPLLAFVDTAGTVVFMCVFNVVIGLDGNTHSNSRGDGPESQMAWLRCQLHLRLKDYNKTQSPLHCVFYFARGERYNQGPCQQPFTLPVSQSPAACTRSWRHHWQVARHPWENKT